jgi:hypothetical protein
MLGSHREVVGGREWVVNSENLISGVLMLVYDIAIFFLAMLNYRNCMLEAF